MSAPLPKATIIQRMGIRRTMPSSLNSRRMTMEDENSILPPPKHTPWNKGKLIGAKQVEV
jgi:hypothetical protein